jgi:hypothetical protein
MFILFMFLTLFSLMSCLLRMNLTEGNDSFVGKQYSGFMSSSWNDTQETGSGESLTDGQIQQGSDPYSPIGDFLLHSFDDIP